MWLSPKVSTFTGLSCHKKATALERRLTPDKPWAYLRRLRSRQNCYCFARTGSAGSRRECPLRQSRNNLNTRPKRRDRLLDDESLVRQVRHNSLYDHERGEAEDRVPPGVGYHCVIPTRQSFIPGNFEKELYKTLEQRRANVVDILSSADAVAVLRTEEDVAELLWMGSSELNQAA